MDATPGPFINWESNPTFCLLGHWTNRPLRARTNPRSTCAGISGKSHARILTDSHLSFKKRDGRNRRGTKQEARHCCQEDALDASPIQIPPYFILTLTLTNYDTTYRFTLTSSSSLPGSRNILTFSDNHAQPDRLVGSSLRQWHCVTYTITVTFAVFFFHILRLVSPAKCATTGCICCSCQKATAGRRRIRSIQHPIASARVASPRRHHEPRPATTLARPLRVCKPRAW